MTAIDRTHLRSLLPHLPRDVAGHILADGTSEVMAGPRDVYGYRSRTVMSWLEEDGGLRPTSEQLDAICAAVDVFPALVDLLEQVDLALERIVLGDDVSPAEFRSAQEFAPGEDFAGLSARSRIIAAATRKLIADTAGPTS